MSNPKSELKQLWKAMVSGGNRDTINAFNKAYQAENPYFPGVKAMDAVIDRNMAILEGDASGRYTLGALFLKFSVKEPAQPPALTLVEGASGGSSQPPVDDKLTEADGRLLGIIPPQTPPDFSAVRAAIDRRVRDKMRDD